MKILIVEDEAVLAFGLQDGLELRGFQVCGTAPNRRAALELAEAHRPDLAIVDVRLSGNDDGVELAAELQRKYGTPVLYATANPEDVQRRANAGLLVVLEKPYSIEEVVRGINSVQRLT